jgi:CubicO group peptidase (beta-lactamase class C family)
MHDTLRHHVESRRLPGLVAVISRRGADHVDAIGTLAFDRTAAMRPNTISRLASVTKPITAVAAMILVEECKLRLDDPVDEFLPELANRKVLRTIDSELDDTLPAKRPITVRDLLTFRCATPIFQRSSTVLRKRRAETRRGSADTAPQLGPGLPNGRKPLGEGPASGQRRPAVLSPPDGEPQSGRRSRGRWRRRRSPSTASRRSR